MRVFFAYSLCRVETGRIMLFRPPQWHAERFKIKTYIYAKGQNSSFTGRAILAVLRIGHYCSMLEVY